MTPAGSLVPQGEKTKKGGTSIFLDGENVTNTLSALEISRGVRSIAKIAEIRAATVDKQRELLGGPTLFANTATSSVEGVIVEGRDIGTVVYPDANVKIYLEAEAEARGRRRFNELVAKNLNYDSKGGEITLQQIVTDIAQRDQDDFNRAHSPLVKARDAIAIDSSNLTIEQVINSIESLITVKLNKTL
ncbi:hypothetical protein BB561_002664 [Smittium simulii]|uniref:(d)CMP kinase n=1 Tax=Smittium simulii TaxID=133385 RepID=A0A2T9YPP0_9FUNG|nr:hypothetical protein BB561_002664 [Smittium simulii]